MTISATLMSLLSPVGMLLRSRRVGPAGSVAATAPALATESRFPLSSPAFADEAEIPARHCSGAYGPNVSPALVWEGLPDGTVQLMLVIEDVDFPSSKHPGIHTVGFFWPGELLSLGEGALEAGNPKVRFLPALAGPKGGYLGPAPLPGHGEHRYFFHLYALDAEVDPSGATSLDEVLPRVQGHVLAAGHVMGTKRG